MQTESIGREIRKRQGKLFAFRCTERRELELLPNQIDQRPERVLRQARLAQRRARIPRWCPSQLLVLIEKTLQLPLLDLEVPHGPSL